MSFYCRSQKVPLLWYSFGGANDVAMPPIIVTWSQGNYLCVWVVNSNYPQRIQCPILLVDDSGIWNNHRWKSQKSNIFFSNHNVPISTSWYQRGNLALSLLAVQNCVAWDVKYWVWRIKPCSVCEATLSGPLLRAKFAQLYESFMCFLFPCFKMFGGMEWRKVSGRKQ